MAAEYVGFAFAIVACFAAAASRSAARATPSLFISAATPLELWSVEVSMADSRASSPETLAAVACTRRAPSPACETVVSVAFGAAPVSCSFMIFSAACSELDSMPPPCAAAGAAPVACFTELVTPASLDSQPCIADLYMPSFSFLTREFSFARSCFSSCASVTCTVIFDDFFSPASCGMDWSSILLCSAVASALSCLRSADSSLESPSGELSALVTFTLRFCACLASFD
mmetsp:Transcript_38565/g.91170  ORF Transcript_38565/g.91170 Transcript_38565/m.91170 type:complete len:229 (-) Transcript_38565:508-1194(-)